MSTRTLCATALPHTCSRPAPTCAPSRCCSDIETLKRRRPICISPNGILVQLPVRSTHSRSRHEENTSTVHEPASPRGGRYRSLCRTVLSCKQSQVDELATTEGAARSEERRV